MQRLLQYPWPGNVRELENVIERAIILSRDGTLSLEGVFGPGPAATGGSRLAAPRQASTTSVASPFGKWSGPTLSRSARTAGGESKARTRHPSRLGLKPSTLYFRMHKLGIVRPA